MVDPISLSVAALLARAVGGALEEVGRGAADALGRLAASVHTRLAGDKHAEQALLAVEQAPADEQRIRALAAAIDERIGADAKFRGEIEGLVAEAERDPGVATFITQVRGHAQVGKIVNIGQAGDVSV